MRKKKISQKEAKKKRIVASVDVSGDVLKYLIFKFEDMKEQTGLCLSVRGDISENKRVWCVTENNNISLNKILKKGTIVQCIDFILMRWKKLKE